ncbi:universal stress protein [Thioalkalivibrio sp.]|uniref:universal stress protein n=1 Tax=Thioalkalivibrio sp. TaxID=2093813 RepID=UPI003565DFC9
MYRHIFVAIDDSPTSRQALKEAISLAQIHGATLEIGHAIDENLVHVFHSTGMDTTTRNELKQALHANAADCLERAAERARRAGVKAESSLLPGHGEHSADLIAAAVEESGADLLVVGSHGRRGVRRLLLGSVAENLVRKVNVSILVVRGPEATEEKE